MKFCLAQKVSISFKKQSFIVFVAENRLRSIMPLAFPLHRMSEYIHTFDFFIFSFLSTILFPVYMLYLNSMLVQSYWNFLFDLYIYLLPFYLIPIALNLMNPSIRLRFFDFLVLPIFPFYQGVLMKLVRLYAYCSEIILRESINDDYVPKRIRSALYDKQNVVKP